MSRPFIIEPDISANCRMAAPRTASRCIKCNYCAVMIEQVPVRKAAEAVRGLWQLPQGGFCL
ncbi:MAG: hypothetical protein WCE98_07020 [Chlorobium sp.]